MKYESLTISGGGLRSSAAIGVLKYLEETEKIKDIKHISGTSGGAIMALLIGFGLSSSEITDFVKEIKKTDIFRPTLRSMFTLEILEKKLRMAIQGRSKEMEIVICTTNLTDNNSEYHSGEEIDLVKRVIASCSLYPFFAPIEINKKFHSDGGYIDNMPNRDFIERKISNISINVNNPYGEFSKNPFKIIRQLAFIVMHSNIKNSAEVADIFLNIKLGNMNMFSFKRIDYAIEEGYIKAKELIT